MASRDGRYKSVLKIERVWQEEADMDFVHFLVKDEAGKRLHLREARGTLWGMALATEVLVPCAHQPVP